ncbi:hypothetical protein ARMGADRAFT_545622 [Armillaria gallica]|uniref:Uncharacterized protein n=1 Tax=Armillaria gallica TaxID=47427 RepID=A0A2H3D353_ARMGA|nr:hypothetical protein ARMGADRAFT_545622 [Armillaria gallica]
MKIQEDSWTGKVVLMAHPGESFSPVLCSAVAYGFQQNGLAAWWELNITLNRDADLPWRKISGGSSGFWARELWSQNLSACCMHRLSMELFCDYYEAPSYRLRHRIPKAVSMFMPSSLQNSLQDIRRVLCSCRSSSGSSVLPSVSCMTVVTVYSHDPRRGT